MTCIISRYFIPNYSLDCIICPLNFIDIFFVIDFAVLVDFTDEEGYGRYLDLHECYEKFINLKGIPKMDYITYLTTFDKMFDLPKERKNASYKE